MSTLNLSRATLVALSLIGPGAWAQGTAAAEPSDWQVFVTERLWAARWDHRLVDASVTAPPTATTPPEVTIGIRQRTASKVVPIHSVGVAYKDFSLSASGWSANFDMGDLTASGRTSRKELDLTLGYNFYPRVTASVIYKHARVDPAVTGRAATLLGLSGRQKGNGLLLGISATAPLSPQLSLYGNFGWGEGRYQVAADVPGHPKAKTRYSIGDFGASYRIDAPTKGIDAVTLQLGYRYQVLAFRDATLQVPATGAPVRIVQVDEGKPQTTTEGLAFSASIAF